MSHRKATWNKRQIKDFVKDVHARVGAGWAYLVPELRVAVIRSKALGIVQAQARDSIAIESVDFLVAAMLEEAGLSGD